MTPGDHRLREIDLPVELERGGIVTTVIAAALGAVVVLFVWRMAK